MEKYSEKLKKQIVAEYLRGVKTTAEILTSNNIPKSNLYRWLKQYGPDNQTDPLAVFNYRNFYLQSLKIERLETIISILKRIKCTVDSPLQKKLREMEKLYGEYPVHTLCNALNVSRGTFYNHIKRNKRDDTYYSRRRDTIKKQILIIDDETNHTFGAAKISALLKERNFNASIEFVRELMRELGLLSGRYGARKLYEKEEEKSINNYLNQSFNADRPNQIWAGDVTHYRFKANEYYICVILDLFARKVVAYKIGFRDNTHLTKATFLIAVRNRNPEPGLIFHSDQGASYRSYAYRKCLSEHGAVQSFSRPRTPQDNAPMESFFASFKREDLYRTRYRSVREFYASVQAYMEWYNTSRPHQNLHYKTPDAYEAAYYAKIQ